MPKIKPVFFNIGLLILVVLLFLGVLEMVLRLGEDIVPASERWVATGDARNYDNLPSLYYTEDVPYHLNAQGMRADKNYSLEKEKYRIAVLGDSVSFGMGVDYHDTFPYLLEKDLGVEVLNFGVAGYDIKANINTLKLKALEFRPDLVLLTVVLNDIEPSGVPFQVHQESICVLPIIKVKISCRYKNIMRKSRVINFFYRGFTNLFYSQVEDYYSLAWGNPTLYDDNIATPLRDFKEICDGGLYCGVVIFPLLEFNATYYQWEQQEDKIKKELEKIGLPYLTLREIYQNYNPKKLGATEEDILHPNALGHGLAAEHIAKFIRYQGFLNNYGEQVIIR